MPFLPTNPRPTKKLQRDRQKAFKKYGKKALLANKKGVTFKGVNGQFTEIKQELTNAEKRGLPFAHIPQKGGYQTAKWGLPFYLLSISNIINIFKTKTPYLGGRFVYRLKIITKIAPRGNTI